MKVFKKGGYWVVKKNDGTLVRYKHGGVFRTLKEEKAKDVMDCLLKGHQVIFGLGFYEIRTQ